MVVHLAGEIWGIAEKTLALDPGLAGKGLFLANLETPLPHPDRLPRPKAGPAISGSSACLSFIKANFEQVCLSLANNHSFDFAEAGLQDTLSACQQAGIATAGAGPDWEAARKPVRLKLDAVEIGLIARCETQFGVAGGGRGGVAALDASLYQTIRQLKKEVDIVIVSLHGAEEMSPWPSPRWQIFCRSLIEAGADLVHGHHSHVPQGYEEYQGGLIFYGMGNFLVDPAAWEGRDNTLWSLVAECDFNSSGRADYRLKIAELKETAGGLEIGLASPEHYHDYLENCNAPLSQPALLEGLWQEVAVRTYQLAYANWLGFAAPHPPANPTLKMRLKQWQHWLQASAKQAPFGRPATKPSRDKLLLWYHLFACENHNDAIATALGVLGEELPDRRTAQTRWLADKFMPWSIERYKS